MAGVKGFKVFNPDWTCKGFQYKVGETYEENVVPNVCNEGFHFCERLEDCFNYYDFDIDNKVAEVIALGDVARNSFKCCTNKIKIVREITWQEVLTMVNTGKNCAGLGNSGDYNSGNYNSGYGNSGNYNSGHCDSGYCNSGNWNSGHSNSGECNSGNWNSGNSNSGCHNCGYGNSGNYNSGDFNNKDFNSGDFNNGGYNRGSYNSGDFNSGDFNNGGYNSGSRNSGDFNSGNYNSGDFNEASYQTGCFNTQDKKITFFDKETDMTLEQWRSSDAYRLISKIDFGPVVWVPLAEMSNAEKSEHPECEITGGYLKIQDNVNCYLEWWDNLSQDEKQIIMDIPNFDVDKFSKITGIQI